MKKIKNVLLASSLLILSANVFAHGSTPGEAVRCDVFECASVASNDGSGVAVLNQAKAESAQQLNAYITVRTSQYDHDHEHSNYFQS